MGVGRGPGLLAGFIICSLLPVPFVALRFWSRKLTKIGWRPNDYLILLSLLPAIGVGIGGCLGITKGGLGKPQDEVTAAEVAAAPLVGLAVNFMWLTAVFLVRLSILHFYKDMFSIYRNTITVLFVVAALCFVHWTGGILIFSLVCNPALAPSASSLPLSKCTRFVQPDFWFGIGSAVLDAVIVVIPQPILWQLQMARQRKFPIACLFGLGIVIVIISSVRCYAITSVNANELQVSIKLTAFLTILEPALGIVNASLPLLSPAAHRITAHTGATRRKGLRPGFTFWRSSAAQSNYDNLSGGSDGPGTRSSGPLHPYHASEFDTGTGLELPRISKQSFTPTAQSHDT